MVLTIKLLKRFDDTHENEMFSKIKDKLTESMKNEKAILLGNISVGSQIDAILIKANSIIILEMKDYNGDITGNENGEWYRTPTYKAINEGGQNPFEQVRKYRGNVVSKIRKAAKEHFGIQRSNDIDDLWIQFTSCLIIFSRLNSFNSDIDLKVAKWFRVTDIVGMSEKVKEIESRAMELSDKEIDIVSEILTGGIDSQTPKAPEEDKEESDNGFVNTSISRTDDIQFLKDEGFVGFQSVSNLFVSCKEIPNNKGVYAVIYEGVEPPTFISKGSGGYFKGKDPNVDTSDLRHKWVPGAKIIYFGQTGNSLRKRITQLMRFGKGMAAPHHGGRYIWQIKDYQYFRICWKPFGNDSDRQGPTGPDGDSTDSPKEYEKELIHKFKSKHDGRLPFANLVE